MAWEPCRWHCTELVQDLWQVTVYWPKSLPWFLVTLWHLKYTGPLSATRQAKKASTSVPIKIGTLDT